MILEKVEGRGGFLLKKGLELDFKLKLVCKSACNLILQMIDDILQSIDDLIK